VSQICHPFENDDVVGVGDVGEVGCQTFELASRQPISAIIESCTEKISDKLLAGRFDHLVGLLAATIRRVSFVQKTGWTKTPDMGAERVDRPDSCSDSSNTFLGSDLV
jgi:hypothetical protein